MKRVEVLELKLKEKIEHCKRRESKLAKSISQLETDHEQEAEQFHKHDGALNVSSHVAKTELPVHADDDPVKLLDDLKQKEQKIEKKHKDHHKSNSKQKSE